MCKSCSITVANADRNNAPHSELVLVSCGMLCIDALDTGPRVEANRIRLTWQEDRMRRPHRERLRRPLMVR